VIAPINLANLFKNKKWWDCSNLDLQNLSELDLQNLSEMDLRNLSEMDLRNLEDLVNLRLQYMKGAQIHLNN